MASSITHLQLFSLGMLSLASGTSSVPLPCCSGCWVRNLPEAKAIAFFLKATICGILGQSQTTERGGNSWKILSSSSRRELRLVDVLFLSLNPEHLMILCFRNVTCQELFDQVNKYVATSTTYCVVTQHSYEVLILYEPVEDNGRPPVGSKASYGCVLRMSRTCHVKVCVLENPLYDRNDL